MTTSNASHRTPRAADRHGEGRSAAPRKYTAPSDGTPIFCAPPDVRLQYSKADAAKVVKCTRHDANNVTLHFAGGAAHHWHRSGGAWRLR
jgi:hypothetical protein